MCIFRHFDFQEDRQAGHVTEGDWPLWVCLHQSRCGTQPNLSMATTQKVDPIGIVQV